MSERILVVGLPGTGKTTYVQKHLGDGLAFDLDYISAALLYKNPHDLRDMGAIKVGNSFLESFVVHGEEWNPTLYIIRTAPKLSEMETIKPTRIVYMVHRYDISDRDDLHEIDEGELLQRLSLFLSEATKLGIPITME